jgi:tRNA dimethylallyltransferase
MTRVVVIGGPTASGKSALALALAETLGGAVINADSMQVYRELAVLTARPGPAETARAPHRLFGVLPGATACSAGRWRELALPVIAEEAAAGRRPIVVGGTGLYLEALMLGLAAVPEIPAEVRAEAAARRDRIGPEAFRAETAGLDPAAARLPAGDTQRLVRAWEVARATGRPLSAWQAAPGAGPPAGLAFDVITLLPPRPALAVRIEARAAAMVAAGALEEVERLLALGLAPRLPIMGAVGVRELAAHLEGRATLPEALAALQAATRRYAKRQTTWFANRPARTGGAVHDCHVVAAVADEQFLESFLPKILPKIRQSR